MEQNVIITVILSTLEGEKRFFFPTLVKKGTREIPLGKEHMTPLRKPSEVAVFEGKTKYLVRGVTRVVVERRVPHPRGGGVRIRESQLPK